MADGRVEYEVRADTSKLDSDLNKAEGGFGKFASGAGKMIAGIAVAVGTAAVSVGKEVINIGSEFEAQMSRVEAISGATNAEMESLTQAAKDYGASTVFTATEVAKAEELMASFGFTATESLAALPGVLGLAAAGGIELSAATETVGSAINQFGLDMSEATHVADVYAEVSARSAAGPLDLKEAMEYAGVAAASLDVSLEETAAWMGVFADNGMKGSAAGTAFSRILTDIAQPTSTAIDAMRELGLYTDEAGSAFFDANGEFVGVTETVSLLQDATQGLTQEEKELALGAIFTQNGLRAVKIAMDENVEGVREATNAYESCDGAAQEMAAVMQDNLKGALEQVGGQFETIGISIYEGVEPALKSAVQAFSEFLDGFMKDGGLDSIIETFKIFAETLSTGLIELMPTLIELFNGFLPILGQLVSGLLPPLIELFTAFAVPILELIQKIMPPIIDLFEVLIEPLKEYIDKILPPIIRLFEGLIPPLADILGRILPPLIDIFTVFMEPLYELLDVLLPPLISIIEIVASTFEILAPIIELLAGLFSGALAGAIKVVADILGAILGVIEKVINGIKRFLGMDVGGKAQEVSSAASTRSTSTGTVTASTTVDELKKKHGYAKGLSYVPYDEYPAVLHKGETILEATEAHLYRSGLGVGAGGYGSYYNDTTDSSTHIGSITINPDAKQWGQLMGLMKQANLAQIQGRAGY